MDNLSVPQIDHQANPHTSAVALVTRTGVWPLAPECPVPGLQDRTVRYSLETYHPTPGLEVTLLFDSPFDKQAMQLSCKAIRC
jgi:hypothetical protein